MPSEQMRQLVQRVIASHGFQRSSALSSFLLYITEHEISGSTEKLKEQTIGVEVLGRRPNYDTTDDNIVRVRAHELRGRLEKYFASEGSEEPVLIRIPRGSYVPEFVPRQAASSPPLEAPAISNDVVAPASASPAPIRRWIPSLAVLLLAMLGSVVVTALFVKRDGHPEVDTTSAGLQDFWSQFFNKPNSELKVVYADTNFALWQDLNRKNLNLGDYLSHKYLKVTGNELDEVAARRATSPADVAVSAHLAILATEFGGRFSVQFARNASAELLHQGNVVLIGSHRSNPWIEVFEPSLNFQLSQDPRTGAPVFRNHSPQPRESPEYGIPALLDTGGDEEKVLTSFGVLALLKYCGDRGFVVIDEGLNMQATEAVGDIVTNPQRLNTFLRSIGHRTGSQVTPFEALIQINSLPGGYDSPRAIAYRTHPPESCIAN